MTLVAVTGGGGFIGAALVDRLLEDGVKTRLLARTPSKIARARDVEIIKGDLDDDAALDQLADGADRLIHLAGVTHARRADDYQRVNVEGARRAAAAAAKAGALFVHASSMSAREPLTSAYARSKRDSETAVAAASGRWIALRLPAIYGPGDRATLPYFKLVRRGLALEPGTPTPARASILFVDDAADALISAARAPTGAVYEVGDEAEGGRSWTEIGAALGGAFGVHPRTIRAPKTFVAIAHAAVRAGEAAFGKTPSVRAGQINEFFHPDWTARDNLLNAAIGWRPETALAEGFAKTVRWYNEQGWL